MLARRLRALPEATVRLDRPRRYPAQLGRMVLVTASRRHRARANALLVIGATRVRLPRPKISALSASTARQA